MWHNTPIPYELRRLMIEAGAAFLKERTAPLSDNHKS